MILGHGKTFEPVLIILVSYQAGVIVSAVNSGHGSVGLIFGHLRIYSAVTKPYIIPVGGFADADFRLYIFKNVKNKTDRSK